MCDIFLDYSRIFFIWGAEVRNSRAAHKVGLIRAVGRVKDGRDEGRK